MPARSFADAVAKANATEEPIKPEPVVDYDHLQAIGMLDQADDNAAAAMQDEAFPDHLVEEYMRQAQAPVQAVMPIAPPQPQPQSDVGSMVQMVTMQNQQLMQSNQMLQQQVMQLTQQLAQLSAQMANGAIGANGTGESGHLKPVKRADRMSETEQWQHMHGEGGLLG